MYHNGSGSCTSYGLVEQSSSAVMSRSGYASCHSDSLVRGNSFSRDSGLERVVANVHSSRSEDLQGGIIQYNVRGGLQDAYGMSRSGRSISIDSYVAIGREAFVHAAYVHGSTVSRVQQLGYVGEFNFGYGAKVDDDVFVSTALGVRQVEYVFDPGVFLKPRREGRFVGDALAVQSYIEEAFELMLGRAFPDTIRVSVLGDAEFNLICSHPGTLGLAINRSEQGLISDIFVRAGSLARVMLTLGHEIGHVLTPALTNPIDEEAKAFAFSFAWMDVIAQYDIGGLGDSFISENPAHNGLHDVACQFVWSQMQQGMSAQEVYADVVSGLVACGVVFSNSADFNLFA